MNWLQVGAAALGALGFGVVFQIRGRKLMLSAVGGGLSWLAYLLVVGAGASEITGMLASSVFASIYSEIMARALKAPATVFYVPSVIPLVPGGSLYYTMIAALEQNWPEFAARGTDTLSFAAAIAGGVVVVISLRSLLRSLAKKKS